MEAGHNSNALAGAKLEASHLQGKNSFQNRTFSELEILLTTLITQIINTNDLISYGNRIKLTQSKVLDRKRVC